ncbi:MAG: DUF302 domain-containing protein [Gammaproteobacteria bacterium]|nr:DUF302 domain-containing protein [Gammaproteobacteria bacterium]
MAIIRNILALIGLVALLAAGYGYATVSSVMSEFDPGSMDMYKGFATKLLESKDPGVAMMHSVPVSEDITADDVIESMKSLATERNFLFVGESPFYKQVEAITGEPYRYINFVSFCDASVGKMMADYRDAYTGFMPCRIAIVEDKNGKLWLYTMDLEMMIYGGRPLPPELKKEALRVWQTIQEVMVGAAAGEF